MDGLIDTSILLWWGKESNFLKGTPKTNQKTSVGDVLFFAPRNSLRSEVSGYPLQRGDVLVRVQGQEMSLTRFFLEPGKQTKGSLKQQGWCKNLCHLMSIVRMIRQMRIKEI